MKDELEALIDRHTLTAVLEALADVCEAKAEHLVSHWQDQQSAAIWAVAALKVSKAAKFADKAHL